MPKMKRHKGVAKRMRLTASGKLKYNKSGAGHLQSVKSGDRRRKLRKDDTVNNPPLVKRYRRALSA
jgi:large subunit ribosomal protein L35